MTASVPLDRKRTFSIESKAAISIVNVYNNNIVVKNKGEVVLYSEYFYVFFNDSLVSAAPDKVSIGPGESLTLTVADIIENKIVQVSGPYGKFDIIVVGLQS